MFGVVLALLKISFIILVILANSILILTIPATYIKDKSTKWYKILIGLGRLIVKLVVVFFIAVCLFLALFIISLFIN